MCVVGNGRRQLGVPESETLLGRQASFVEIMASPALGIVGQNGFIEYHELWTAVPLDDRALFIVGFYEKNDAAARREVVAAFKDLESSLLLFDGNTSP
jgi:hypothetical protein